MSETTCRKCADLRRTYGWACEDLRDAARKLVKSGGKDKFAERVRDAKYAKSEAAQMLNAHRATEHAQDGVA